MSYTTCALQSSGTGNVVNPFTRGEYEGHCKKEHNSSHATSVCVVGGAEHAQLPKSCTTRPYGGGKSAVVLSETCLRDMRAMSAAPNGAVAGPSAPMFSDAVTCRSKLGGEFKTLCEQGGKDKKAAPEVTFADLSKSIGGGCELCCGTVLKEEVDEKKKGDKKADGHKAGHSEADVHRPRLFPFMH